MPVFKAEDRYFATFPPGSLGLDLAAMAMKFELQEHLGKYPIVREIGSGATSRVYLARDGSRTSSSAVSMVE